MRIPGFELTVLALLSQHPTSANFLEEAFFRTYRTSLAPSARS